jgi:DNA polymerase-3 subunit epsilon
MSGPPFPNRRRDLVFCDLETSGLDSTKHEILELAAVRTNWDASKVILQTERKCTLTNPEAADPDALKVNGYSAAAWAKAVPIRVALCDLIELAGPLPGNEELPIFVAYGAGFDMGFLAEAYRRAALAPPRFKYQVDMLSVCWPLCVKGHLEQMSLAHVCAKYGVSNDGKHEAMADTRRLIAVYRAVMGFGG